MEEKEPRAQGIFCKCGALYAISVEPHCYTSTDFRREIKRGLLRGATVDMLSLSEAKEKFNPCKCK